MVAEDLNRRRRFSIEVTELAIAGTVTLVMGSLSFALLAPQVGIDDANITQVYARNIANGHGFVYNIGGERVEGSTSFLWTMITAAAFLIADRPESGLAVLGGLIAISTMLVSMRMARLLFRESRLDPLWAPAIVGLIYVSSPTFFSWMIWSLMDIGLWVFLIALLAYSAIAIFDEELRSKRHSPALAAAFLSASAAIPLCRPEGIAVVVGAGMICFAAWLLVLKRPLPRTIVLGVAAGVASVAALTAFRMAYFGYPVPNTFYAKVSTDVLDQLIQGGIYTVGYLAASQTFLLFLGAAIGAIYVARPRNSGEAFSPLFAVCVIFGLVVGGLCVYTALGGDHFRGARFYQFNLPLLAPLAAVAAAGGIKAASAILRPHPGHHTTRLVIGTVAAVAVLAAVLVPLAGFVNAPTPARVDFRLAEIGREIGDRLNTLSIRPRVAVIPAGGIAVTYEGDILDLMGLNWVEMAHAEHAKADKFKNHGGFNRDVFFRARPDLVTPILGCDVAPLMQDAFASVVLDNLFESADFKAAYVFSCAADLGFFVRRDYLAEQGGRLR